MRYLIVLILWSAINPASAQFKTEEKVFVSAGELKGTLVLPSGKARFDLLVIQAGSGPTDRNGNSPYGIKAGTYRLLAEALAKKKIATLLTDKRGIAGSARAGKKESDLLFTDYADDLAGWINLMKKDPRIKKIFIAGHSEGSLLGMLAAQKEEVAGYISIAGAGESIDRILVWQFGNQSPATGRTLDSLLTRLKNNEKIDKVPAAFFSILRPSIQPYIASWMRLDPCVEIKKLSMPVLIIQGTTDLQVTLKQGDMLKACRPDAKYVVFEGMNHILKKVSADKTENVNSYSDVSLPLMPGPVKQIAAFIKR
ncbi:MAG: alpha/beta fold hydrolase [Ferruginibacter sp.]